MHKISLLVLLAAAVFVSGCKTKAYVREMNREQGPQNQSVQNNTNLSKRQQTQTVLNNTDQDADPPAK